MDGWFEEILSQNWSSPFREPIMDPAHQLWPNKVLKKNSRDEQLWEPLTERLWPESTIKLSYKLLEFLYDFMATDLVNPSHEIKS